MQCVAANHVVVYDGLFESSRDCVLRLFNVAVFDPLSTIGNFGINYSVAAFGQYNAPTTTALSLNKKHCQIRNTQLG